MTRAEARRGEWPEVRLGALARSLLPLVAGALALWGALARESTADGGPVDPAALLLRVVGCALVAQGAVGLVRVIQEIRRDAAGPRASILVDGDRIELDLGRGLSTVKRADVASVRTSKA